MQEKKITQVVPLEVPGAGRREQIPFSETLLPGAGVRLIEGCSYTGHIKEVIMHFPPGCNGLVDVAAGHGLVHFCPREGFLALDSAFPVFVFNESVKEHEELWVIMQNRDALNPHTITVTMTVEED